MPQEKQDREEHDEVLLEKKEASRESDVTASIPLSNLVEVIEQGKQSLMYQLLQIVIAFLTLVLLLLKLENLLTIKELAFLTLLFIWLSPKRVIEVLFIILLILYPGERK